MGDHCFTPNSSFQQYISSPVVHQTETKVNSMDFLRVVFCIPCCHVCTDDAPSGEMKPRQLKLTNGKRWRTSRVLEAPRRWSRRPASSLFSFKDEKRFTGFDMFSILATCPEEHPAPERLSAYLIPHSSVQNLDLIGTSFSSMCLDEENRFSLHGSKMQSKECSDSHRGGLLNKEYQPLPLLEPDLLSSSFGGTNENEDLPVQSMANRPLSVVYEYPESHTRSLRLSRLTQFSISSNNQTEQNKREPELYSGEPKVTNAR
jgi:hypothetical protein